MLLFSIYLFELRQKKRITGKPKRVWNEFEAIGKNSTIFMTYRPNVALFTLLKLKRRKMNSWTRRAMGAGNAFDIRPASIFAQTASFPAILYIVFEYIYLCMCQCHFYGVLSVTYTYFVSLILFTVKGIARYIFSALCQHAVWPVFHVGCSQLPASPSSPLLSQRENGPHGCFIRFLPKNSELRFMVFRAV